MHLAYIQKSARLSWGKTEGYRCPLRVSCSFNNDGVDLCLWLQILHIPAVESICWRVLLLSWLSSPPARVERMCNYKETILVSVIAQ